MTSADIARAFHETYERLAPEYGYETRRESAVVWEQVPEANRALMVAVVDTLIDAQVILPPEHRYYYDARTQQIVEGGVTDG